MKVTVPCTPFPPFPDFTTFFREGDTRGQKVVTIVWLCDKKGAARRAENAAKWGNGGKGVHTSAAPRFTPSFRHGSGETFQSMRNVPRAALAANHPARIVRCTRRAFARR